MSCLLGRPSNCTPADCPASSYSPPLANFPRCGRKLHRGCALRRVKLRLASVTSATCQEGLVLKGGWGQAGALLFVEVQVWENRFCEERCPTKNGKDQFCFVFLESSNPHRLRYLKKTQLALSGGRSPSENPDPHPIPQPPNGNLVNRLLRDKKCVPFPVSLLLPVTVACLGRIRPLMYTQKLHESPTNPRCKT